MVAYKSQKWYHLMAWGSAGCRLCKLDNGMFKSSSDTTVSLRHETGIVECGLWINYDYIPRSIELL